MFECHGQIQTFPFFFFAASHESKLRSATESASVMAKSHRWWRLAMFFFPVQETNLEFLCQTNSRGVSMMTQIFRPQYAEWSLTAIGAPQRDRQDRQHFRVGSVNQVVCGKLQHVGRLTWSWTFLLVGFANFSSLVWKKSDIPEHCWCIFGRRSRCIFERTCELQEPLDSQYACICLQLYTCMHTGEDFTYILAPDLLGLFWDKTTHSHVHKQHNHTYTW
jgi:hypothetical protein